ncbi:ABC transporter substrate-binding protein [Gluconobacter frateurii]|uniref:ABC transporter periplasmic protein n=1 Tax=Gluconobacter frateurii NRIC 0228 TaxID=1307946 RepID=A0ABQ0QFE8_9PROT|nr:ABC transporter substrate-binding protein [Gluconobacter frateurii]GBR16994.1 ABC transporter periplasmic protein [Gluconobacter frateurii NRIC 0228]GLP90719.1 peptide ABC transporter substrate-binding protein [Gluconobacter frateurii]
MRVASVLGRRPVLKGAGLFVAGMSTRSAMSAPISGGHLKVAGAVGSASETLDPAHQSMATDYIRGHLFYDGLVSLDDRLNPRPALAEALDSDDLLTWHIRLRRNVRFHDGAVLTADDVVFSLLRHQDPGIGSQQYALARTMQSVRAVSPLMVEIVLQTPNSDFPAILGISNFAILKAGTRDFRTANGTGPFRCQEFAPGIRTVAVRNSEFWGEKPHLDSVELIAIPDEMARHNALMSGDVDLIATVNPRLVQMLEKAGFGIVESPVGTYTDLSVRLDQRYGHSPDFVEGIKFLLNREQIRQSVFLGFSRLGNDQPIPPESPYFNNQLPQRVYDPDKAQFLLKRSGFLGETIPLVCSPAALASVDIAVVLQYAASRIGQKMAVQRVPADGYWTQYWMKSSLGFGNINPRPAPSLTFEVGFASASPWNESRWHNPYFDRLLQEAKSTRDDAKKRQLYWDMQELVASGSGVCIPNFTNSLDAYAPHICGLRPSQAGQLMGYDFARSVWLSEKQGRKA